MRAQSSLLSLALAALTLPAIAQVSDAVKEPPVADPTRPPMTSPAQERLRDDIRAADTAALVTEKQRLETVLAKAGSRDDYATLLEREGYEITAVNKAEPQSLEYEIVKGRTTYEVSLVFDERAQRARSIDVTSNLWRAKETKEKMKGEAPQTAPVGGIRQPAPAGQ